MHQRLHAHRASALHVLQQVVDEDALLGFHIQPLRRDQVDLAFRLAGADLARDDHGVEDLAEPLALVRSAAPAVREQRGLHPCPSQPADRPGHRFVRLKPGVHALLEPARRKGPLEPLRQRLGRPPFEFIQLDLAPLQAGHHAAAPGFAVRLGHHGSEPLGVHAFAEAELGERPAHRRRHHSAVVDQQGPRPRSVSQIGSSPRPVVPGPARPPRAGRTAGRR